MGAAVQLVVLFVYYNSLVISNASDRPTNLKSLTDKIKLPARFKSWDYLLVNLLLIAISYCLYKGITLPLISFNQFKFFGNTFSVISGIQVLKENEQLFLYWVVLCFSVIFPALKLLMLFFAWNSPYASWKSKILHFMIVIGRWSMLDVMIVAILVAWVKIDMIADVKTHEGLNYFVTSVFAIIFIKMYISWRLKRQNRDKQNKQPQHPV